MIVLEKIAWTKLKMFFKSTFRLRGKATSEENFASFFFKAILELSENSI